MISKHRLLRAVSIAVLAGTAWPAAAQVKIGASSSVTTVTSKIVPLARNIRPFARNIRAFWGAVNPFYRNVSAYWGDVDPFARNIRAFWGTIDPVKMATAAGAPSYPGVAPFWEGIGVRWDAISGRWQTAGSYAAQPATYAGIATDLQAMVAASKTFWSDAVTKKTGKSFEAGFADPLFARFGIDPKNPASLATLSASEQSHFFMDWYDGLMEFSGTDHADWWMKSVNWSPVLTQRQGNGSGAVIGLVDFFVADDADIGAKTIYSGGVSTFTNGHGSGVGSLIVASHDGKGIMGIAPGAKVAAFNPFDATGTSDWAAVKKGMIAVAGKGASVINLSLGVPGKTFAPEWRGIFNDSSLDSLKDRTMYVIAAGNDGITQTGNVEMNGALDHYFIVVGSVDATNTISDFSNRPGTVCLTDGGQCKNTGELKESGYLMNRFIVAPGELLLVADGKGGVTRQSGTSLAAPLVAGAVALVQSRWPWLKEKPMDVAKIILDSARDLGAPGIDPVYGVGLLDVQGAQSPLDYNKLKYYLVSGSSQQEVAVSSLRGKGIPASWETKGLYFSAFEKVDQAERDFLIPLSTRLFGTQKNGQYFQEYIYNAMQGWLKTGRLASTGALGFSAGSQAPAKFGEWTMGLSGRLQGGYATANGYLRTSLATAVSLRSPGGRFGLSVGQGDGALMLGGGRGFGLSSDLDPRSGGVNPLLGFASGGAHMAAQVALTPDMQLSVGMTEQRRSRSDELLAAAREDRPYLDRLGRYRAAAANVRVDYRAGDRIGLSASFTRLHEPNAFLGVRSIERSDFAGGTTTGGLTIGASADLGRQLSLFGSVTASRATTAGATGAFRLTSGGALGTAYQLGLVKDRLFGRNDRVRLSFAQPLTTERGSVEFSSVEVIDRETGEIGTVARRFDIAGQGRRYVAEAQYGLSLLDGRGEVSLFGRGELRPVAGEDAGLMIGGRTRLSF